jgi:Fe2+ transport system protein FeoA
MIPWAAKPDRRQGGALMGMTLDTLKRYFDVLEVYHTGQKSARALVDVKPDSEVIVKKITGGKTAKSRLIGYGIREGENLYVIGWKPWYDFPQEIFLRVGEREVRLAFGLAKKIWATKSETEMTKEQRGRQ